MKIGYKWKENQFRDQQNILSDSQHYIWLFHEIFIEFEKILEMAQKLVQNGKNWLRDEYDFLSDNHHR